MYAIFAALFVCYALLIAMGYALIRSRRPEEPQEPEEDELQLRLDFVTHEQLDQKLSQEAKKWEWLLDEWHEKFSTLHARLAKRTKTHQQQQQVEQEQPDIPRLSAAHLRRVGSP